MHLGFGLVTAQRHPQDPEQRSYGSVYQEILALARSSEAAGLESFWVSEHHFAEDGYLPAPLVVLGAIASVTQRIQLGTAVLLAPLWHPVRLAEDAAVVDLLSGGRLMLGLGLGWRDPEFSGFGVPRRERAPRLEAAVGALRQAWRGDPVDLAGGVAVRPGPARPGGPPILIGGYADAAIERAARLGDGFLAGVMTLQELTVRLQPLRELGRPFVLAAHVPVFVWDGPEDPWSIIREAQWYVRWTYEQLAGSDGRPGEPAPPPPMDSDSERRLRRRAVVGRSEQVLSELARYRRALGDDGHLIARAYYPGLPWDVQRRQVELLGELAGQLAR
jgi:alkanesulfonate monooxygenase SsuD/methylene tetrahydromethanopterin reductase-like flavin-dependent oxidoreductase (luciferase family)